MARCGSSGHMQSILPSESMRRCCVISEHWIGDSKNEKEWIETHLTV